MDVNNISNNGREPCRRLDFENSDNLSIFNEVEVVNMNHENDIDDYMSTEPTKVMSNIHERIPEELIPKIDMEFESEDDAENFYLAYAKAVGFGVRVSKSHKDKSKSLILDRIFCCSREGERKIDVRDANVKSCRAVTRCHCPAEMKISCRGTGKYRVVRFVDGHNHACASPSKSYYFRSHRKMSNTQKADIDMAISCGIAQRETMELLAKKVGGPEHLGFLSDDCKNYLRSKRKNKMQIGDTGGVLQYLQKKQAEDLNFFYAIQVDEDDLITNIFWADAKMRSDYSHFGDVVSFDTTYRKHKDGRPIALFVGVNNHKDTVVFGAALLYDETAVTFSWLFDTFAATMSGKKPQTILTDQDKAMSKALISQWPETCHRLCVWHINQNAASNLSHVFAQYKDFAKEFSSCMYDHDEEDEFIVAWNKMIEKYNLQGNSWLNELFKIRKKWALVYGRETFCADMSTTQRSESMNSAIKKYVSYKNELVEFFGHFERLVNDRRYKESRADFMCDQSTPSLSFPLQILKHAAAVYTHKIFQLFQAEVCKGIDCNLEIDGENEVRAEFKVASFGKQYHHRVTYDSSDGSISCSCKKFEFVGILCSHALKVLNYKRVIKIPDQYIKKRWMKTAKKKNIKVEDYDMTQVDPREVMTYRYRELGQFYNQLTIRAAESQKPYEIAKQGLKKLLEQVDASFEQGGLQEATDIISVANACISNNVESNVNGNISGKKVRGIKVKEKITYKTSKRPRGGLEKSTRRKKATTDLEKKRNPVLTTSAVNIASLSSVKENTLSQESYSQVMMPKNCLNISVAEPYSNASAHINQYSNASAHINQNFLKEPQIGVSKSNINDVDLFSSTEKQGALIDLLKKVDPNENEEQFFITSNPNHQLSEPSNSQFK